MPHSSCAGVSGSTDRTVSGTGAARSAPRFQHRPAARSPRCAKAPRSRQGKSFAPSLRLVLEEGCLGRFGCFGLFGDFWRLGRFGLFEGRADQFGYRAACDDLLTALDGDDELLPALAGALNLPVVALYVNDFHLTLLRADRQENAVVLVCACACG